MDAKELDARNRSEIAILAAHNQVIAWCSEMFDRMDAESISALHIELEETRKDAVRDGDARSDLILTLALVGLIQTLLTMKASKAAPAARQPPP